MGILPKGSEERRNEADNGIKHDDSMLEGVAGGVIPIDDEPTEFGEDLPNVMDFFDNGIVPSNPASSTPVLFNTKKKKAKRSKIR